MNRSEVEIVRKFNSEIRGIYNYYQLADNVSVLNAFYYIMKGSLLKAFAAKFQSSINQMKAKHCHGGVFGVDYYNKAGRQRCELYHDGFTKKDKPLLEDVDVLPEYKRYDKPNSLATRFKAGVCEACSSRTKEIHMHHVKRLKDLTGRTEFELLMMAKRRKSLALCPVCFNRVKSSECIDKGRAGYAERCPSGSRRGCRRDRRLKGRYGAAISALWGCPMGKPR